MGLYSARDDAIVVTATMTTLLEVNPPASRFTQIVQYNAEFSGISATDVPVIVQECIVTATSAAGTAITPAAVRDLLAAVAATAKKSPATEGTVTIIHSHNVPPSSGLVIQYPLQREPWILGAAATAKGFSLRANRGAGAAINSAASLDWEE
jgi:hypothetical protein